MVRFGYKRSWDLAFQPNHPYLRIGEFIVHSKSSAKYFERVCKKELENNFCNICFSFNRTLLRRSRPSASPPSTSSSEPPEETAARPLDLEPSLLFVLWLGKDNALLVTGNLGDLK
jgi:hypothetical protein